MGRIMAIDYGQKRCGIAVTDELQISANPLKVLPTGALIEYIVEYCRREHVDKIVFGKSVHADGSPTYVQEDIEKCVKRLAGIISIEIDYQDESYTSREAKEILNLIAGKKKRSQKELTDLVSAVLILQRYLNHI